MLNNSKRFVRYLDNYDEKSQIQYRNNLLVNIQNEYNNTWSDGSKLMASNVNMKDNNIFHSENFFIDAIKREVKNESKIKVEKKYIDITEKIETIDDLLLIIDKYEYNENYEYNIDFHSIVKIKLELTQLNNMIGMKKLKYNVLDQLLDNGIKPKNIFLSGVCMLCIPV